MLLCLSTGELIFSVDIGGNNYVMWPSNPKDQRWWTEYWGLKLI